MMRKSLVMCLLNAFVLLAAGSVCGQTAGAPASQATPAQNNASQQRAVGEVVSVDASARRLVVKTDEGASVSIEASDQTSISRVPAGANASEKAVRISLSEITVGERLFARGDMNADGASLNARQIVVTSRTAGASAQAGSENAQPQQGRGVVGRITALNPERREIQIAARARDEAETITVTASGEQVRIRRFAPDSLSVQDAVPASFAELRVGDQLRATGERSTDGSRFVAEEIVAGSVLRVGGTVTAVNAATGELTIKSEQGGQTHTILVGKRSMLRRIPAEVAESMTQRREGRREERRAQRGEAAGGANAEGEGRRARTGEGSTDNAERGANRQAGGERRRAGGGGGGGRNLMQMLENLPAITLAELKKGDMVLVTGTTSGADASRLTAVALLTGDPAFLARMRRFQGRGGRDGQNMSPGLPGDILGGGIPNPREQP